MSHRYHRDISVAAPRLPQYFLVRILGLTPQAMYLSPLRGSGPHDNFSSGLDTAGRNLPCILHLASWILHRAQSEGIALMRLMALKCGYLLSFLFFQYLVPAMSAKAIRPLSVIW